jgi:hypothetical protein
LTQALRCRAVAWSQLPVTKIMPSLTFSFSSDWLAEVLCVPFDTHHWKRFTASRVAPR